MSSYRTHLASLWDGGVFLAILMQAIPHEHYEWKGHQSSHHFFSANIAARRDILTWRLFALGQVSQLWHIQGWFFVNIDDDALHTACLYMAILRLVPKMIAFSFSSQFIFVYRPLQ